MTRTSADWRRLFPALALAVAALAAATCGDAADLPPEIQADLYLVQADRQIQAGDHDAAVATLDKIFALQRDHGLAIPPAFWFKHAQVSRDAGRFEQAIESATRYLMAEGQQGQHYMAALEILDASGQMMRVRMAGEHFQDCSACPEMVVIPAGAFRMGCLSDDDDCDGDENPVREVRIPQPFALSKHEVTRSEFSRFVEAAGYSTSSSCITYEASSWEDRSGRGWRYPGVNQSDVHPVVCVSWRDAEAYAAWLSRESGQEYRLPSESEWEYAARAGTVTKYSWGNEIGRNRANCAGCGSRWDGDRTAPVGSFAANAFGLHDMHGNVWEWVEDCLNGSYSGAPSDGGAWLSGDCFGRVLRGGSWGDLPRDLRSANRVRYATSSQRNYIGFRVARTLTP